MKGIGAIARHRTILPPAFWAEIPRWQADPELAKLIDRLDKSSDERFPDSLAEVMVARHLLGHACRLRVEVRTQSGRSADFEVCREGLCFYAHVKGLSAEGPFQQHIRISSRLEELKRIGLPLIAWVSFQSAPSDADMQLFVRQAGAFLRGGAIGDRLVVTGDNGVELGKCVIECASRGGHVDLMVGHPTRSSDGVSRPKDRFRAAYQQFVTGAVNVIILVHGTSTEDEEGISNALFGTLRCTVAPDGTELDAESLGDGFWSGGKHSKSQVAAWFNPLRGWEEFHSELWFRKGHLLDPAMTRLLKESLKT